MITPDLINFKNQLHNEHKKQIIEQEESNKQRKCKNCGKIFTNKTNEMVTDCCYHSGQLVITINLFFKF